MVLETVFDRLHRLRNSKKLAKKDMAEVLGCTPTSYSRYENGERELGIKSLIPIYHMGCNLNWLITGRGDMELCENDLPLPLEKEIIKSLTVSNEKQAVSLANCSEAMVLSAKTAENLSELLAKQPTANRTIVSNNGNNKSVVSHGNYGNMDINQS